MTRTTVDVTQLSQYRLYRLCVENCATRKPAQWFTFSTGTRHHVWLHCQTSLDPWKLFSYHEIRVRQIYGCSTRQCCNKYLNYKNVFGLGRSSVHYRVSLVTSWYHGFSRVWPGDVAQFSQFQITYIRGAKISHQRNLKHKLCVANSGKLPTYDTTASWRVAENAS